MYNYTPLVKKFIVFLALLLPISACVNNKKINSNIELDEVVVWQYSNYLNNTEIDKDVTSNQ